MGEQEPPPPSRGEEENESYVIVPAILGVGLVFSLVTYARDLTRRWHGRHDRTRRAIVDGRTTAVLTLAGPSAARSDHTLFLARSAYVVIGVSLLSFAAYVTVGSFGNFIGFTNWAVNIAWLWWLFLTAALAFAITGVASLVVAVRWDRPPAWVHPLLSVTPLSTVRHRAPHLHAHPG